jgi:nucleoside-diphosphate-sugar epimerase
MSESHRKQQGPPAPPAGVDVICDAFEAAWLAGHEPRIEDFLPGSDPVHQDVLLRELLLAKWDLRGQHEQNIELQTYHGRFPENKQSIRDLWRVWTEKQSQSVPNGTAWRVGAALEGVYRLLRLHGEPRMTRFLAAQLSTSHYFDISRARNDFGYEPKISTEEGMRRLAQTLHEGCSTSMPDC